jgi:hypothetical protein
MSVSMLCGTSYLTFKFENFIVDEKSCNVILDCTCFTRPILQKLNFSTLAFDDIFVKLWFMSGTFVISSNKFQFYYWNSQV